MTDDEPRPQLSYRFITEGDDFRVVMPGVDV